MGDAQGVSVDPHCGQRRAHSALFGMRFRRFEDVPVREIDSTDEALGLLREAGSGISVKWRSGIDISIHAMLYDSLDSESAGNFSVRFAAHAVGEDIQVQRLDEPETILIVGTHPTHIGRAAACNSHNTPLGPGTDAYTRAHT